MANPEKNWEGRDIDSRGPKFRIDVNNPEMGDAGKNAYLMVGTTENETTQFSALSETGTYMLHNEKSIEIVSAEPTNSNTAIKISAQKGNFEIIVSDGQVKIKGSNIVFESATDITMKAGRNISLNAGQNVTLKGIKASASALVGNLVHATGSFIEKVYKPTYVGTDYLRNPPALDPFLKKGVVPGIGDVEDLKSFAEENVGELKSVAKDVGDQLKSAAKDFNVDDIKKSFDVDSIKKLF
tara:strand:- start:13575 stop:14294 length:720 start_codon:yes stop_codon:yes gene_type:complete